MYNDIMNLMNSLEARYRKDMCDNTIENTENKYNILLAVDPLTIAMSGLAIAAGGVLHFETEMVTTILVDGNYLNMTDTGKRFVIAHELGHIECQIEKFRQRITERNLADEFEADEYAMKQIGLKDSIKGLKEIRKFLLLHGAIDSVKELNKRIRNLRIKAILHC